MNCTIPWAPRGIHRVPWVTLHMCEGPEPAQKNKQHPHAAVMPVEGSGVVGLAAPVGPGLAPCVPAVARGLRTQLHTRGLGRDPWLHPSPSAAAKFLPLKLCTEDKTSSFPTARQPCGFTILHFTRELRAQQSWGCGSPGHGPGAGSGGSRTRSPQHATSIHTWKQAWEGAREANTPQLRQIHSTKYKLHHGFNAHLLPREKV